MDILTFAVLAFVAAALFSDTVWQYIERAWDSFIERVWRS